MELFGLPWTEALIVIAIILIVADTFFPADVATHLAYMLLAIVAGGYVPLHWLYQVLVGMLAWFLIVAFHYAVWKSILRRLQEHIAPQRYQSGMHGMVDKRGVVRVLSGRRMVEIHGDLWPSVDDNELPNGSHVRVTGHQDGRLHITKDK